LLVVVVDAEREQEKSKKGICCCNSLKNVVLVEKFCDYPQLLPLKKSEKIKRKNYEILESCDGSKGPREAHEVREFICFMYHKCHILSFVCEMKIFMWAY